MAIASIIFGFPSGYDGFTANPAGATVLSHNTVDGNPDAGCLQASLTGRNVNAGTSNWSKDIRFDNDVGVPAGATLNNVRVTINWRCSNWYVGATGANSTGVSLVGVGSADSGYFESTTAWASLSTGWVVPTGGIADSRTLQALATLRTANNGSANVTAQLDTIVVEVDYDAGSIDGAVSFSSAGVMAAAATAIRSGQVDLQGTGMMTVTGQRVVYGSVGFAGVGTMQATGQLIKTGSIAFVGTGTMTARGEVEGFINGHVAFLAGGELTVSAGRIVSASVSFAGAGVFDIKGTRIVRGALSLQGTGTLYINARKTVSAMVSFLGAGILTVSARDDLIFILSADGFIFVDVETNQILTG